MPMEGFEKGYIMTYEEKPKPAQGEWRKVTKPILTLLLCAFMFLTGCATIMTGKYQNIPVTSEPPGIEVRSCTGVSMTTPGSFKLVRNKDYTLFAEYSGCEPQQKEFFLDQHFNLGCYKRRCGSCFRGI